MHSVTPCRPVAGHSRVLVDVIPELFDTTAHRPAELSWHGRKMVAARRSLKAWPQTWRDATRLD